MYVASRNGLWDTIALSRAYLHHVVPRHLGYDLYALAMRSLHSIHTFILTQRNIYPRIIYLKPFSILFDNLVFNKVGKKSFDCIFEIVNIA